MGPSAEIKCPRCGLKCLIGHTADGKRIPLDPRVAIYSVFSGRMQDDVTRTTMAMADHREVCRDPKGAVNDTAKTA